ncbi:MAG: DUF2270 domain-containing protein [Parvularculaceae bacterium]|nr:DUF2270 domain-containing protein [Parvularculaceae bacterium]
MSETDTNWRQWRTPPGGTGNEFDSSEIGALAHLYRGEVYRSTIWRTRLDATTNWSVVTLGLAMSISFASPAASPLPLLLVGILIAMFLVLEARRYRYFNVWRARCRWIETNFYAPLLLRSHKPDPGQWQDVLAQDYLRPQYHIGFYRAMGRRLRRNYSYILSFQAVAYSGKILVHPTPVNDLGEVMARMAVGPIPGFAVLIFGVAFHLAWISLALRTRQLDNAKHKGSDGVRGMG